ncbi:hypothetical protein OROGR_030777 [Orobanche gracilis]
MDMFSISSAYYSDAPISAPYSTSNFVGKKHYATTSTSVASVILASDSSQDFAHNNDGLRRPITQKPLTASTSGSSKLPENPLKKFVHSRNNPSVSNSPSHDTLSNKLWLSSKLTPPPPPPPPNSPFTIMEKPHPKNEVEDEVLENFEESEKEVEFRETGKIFVGNLPRWIRKHEVTEFFRQFGPIKNVILIKGHDDLERNMGFGFVIYSGHTADKAAMKAVEFDGVEFHGRVLTVKLDNGNRIKNKLGERAMWVDGKDEDEGAYRSKWHGEREGSRREFRKVLESQPENWQAVVRAFERINKPSRREFGLMVNYYARKGDMHRARETFEKMRARGIEPTLHVYTSPYSCLCSGKRHGRSIVMSCVRKMRDEGIEISLVTYNILVGGFAKTGNVEAAELWFKEAKDRLKALNAVIYGNIIYAYCMEKAVNILDKMLLARISPNEHSYTTIMHGYASLGDTEKAFGYFSKIKNEGLELDVFTYEALLKACCKSSRMQSALAVTKEMKAQNIPRNTFIYNILMDGWARRGDVWEAADLMQQMRQAGVQPDIHTYTSFINACCKAGVLGTWCEQ